jgi:hypothetical protein
MFDGFDEVSHYKYELLQLFDSLLKPLNVKKIVITTRSHLKDELEEKFGVLSFSISPLGLDDDCQNFLNKYWLQSIKVDEKSIEKIQKFSKTLVNKLNGSILNKFKNFIEIPLQLKMIADIYKNDLIEQLENRAKKSSLEISNLTDLYEKFIDSKFIIKYNEKNNFNIERDKFIYNDIKDKILKYHIHLSKIYIIDNNNNNEAQKEQQVSEQNMLAEVLGYGIIVNFKDSMPIFIHQSYAEYFIASFLFNSIRKKEIQDIFEDILFIDKHFLVRKFLDGFLERIKQLETPNIIFEKLKIKNKHILHIVASENMKHILESIYFDNEDLKIKNDHGRTPLHMTAERGNNEIVYLLIEKGAEIDEIDNEEWTPIHLASHNGHIEVVNALIEKGAKKIDEFNEIKLTPLHMASENGHAKIVERLIETGANIDKQEDIESLRDMMNDEDILPSSALNLYRKIRGNTRY